MAKEVFPKIEAKTKVKSYERLKDGLKIKFDSLKLPLSKQAVLDGFIDNEDEVKFRIESTQGRLPGCE